MRKPTFEVDKEGLAKLLTRRGIENVILELVQNALDENVTGVTVTLERSAKAKYCHIAVSDDSPEGFKDLRHAYTLFADTSKRYNPEQRGRFNLGEKLVIAACRWAKIVTTKGTVTFENGGRVESRECSKRGSIFYGELRMTREEEERAKELVRMVIIPPGVRLVLNGDVLPRRGRIASSSTYLPTEVADEEGYLKRTNRATRVDVYELLGDETAMLYEMGIPVVETGDQWHVNIQQKVPLNADRDNVPPSYLRAVRAVTLNLMSNELTREEASASWIGHALEDQRVRDVAVEDVVEKRYGEKRVIRDPSDPEGTKLAVSQGYSIIEPGSFSKEQWATIKRVGAALPAGQVTPSPKAFSDGGTPLKLLDEEKWSPGICCVVAYAEALASRLLVKAIEVVVANDITWPFAAVYGDRKLTFNLGRLGRKWFDAPQWSKINALLIHEFGHHYSGDHLSEQYHDALCELGARLAKLALEEPQFFARHQEKEL